MRWLLDECADAVIVEQLRQAGHDVVYVAETAPRVSDVEVMSLAKSANRLLLTEDKDFGEQVFRQMRQVPGIVLLRTGPMRGWQKAERLLATIERLGDTLFGRYTVIEGPDFDLVRFGSTETVHRTPFFRPIPGADGTPGRVTHLTGK